MKNVGDTKIRMLNAFWEPHTSLVVTAKHFLEDLSIPLEYPNEEGTIFIVSAGY